MKKNLKQKISVILKFAAAGTLAFLLLCGISSDDAVLAKTSNLKTATVTGVNTKNYTGKPVTLPKLKVKMGKKTLKKGKDYTVSYKHNKKQGYASVTIRGKGKYKGSITKKFLITVWKGKKYTVDKLKYQVTNTGENGIGAVAIAGSSFGKTSKKLTQLKIRDYVDIGGKKYRVTAVGKGAFKGYKNIQSVIIGNCVEEIGREAFFNCKKLEKVTVKTYFLKSVGKRAFRKTNKNIRIRIPVSKAKTYGRLFAAGK